VRLGLHLPQFRIPVAAAAITSVAQAAERAELDDLWVSDHLILAPGSTRPPAVFHDALTVLTWAGAVTERIGLGTSVLVAPYRHPVVLAKALASLDALSGGRVIAGLASGWLEPEFAALGVPFAERGRRTDEAIAVCRALWSGATEYATDGRTTTGVAIAPLPARAGGPPIWIGGNGEAGIRRAVQSGDGWHTTISDPVLLDERMAVVTKTLTCATRDRASLTVSVRVRTTSAEFAQLAPRLRSLGIDHVVIDHRDIIPHDLNDELARLRDAAA
jgi:probable F420-dependent oxidoreductase